MPCDKAVGSSAPGSLPDKCGNQHVSAKCGSIPQRIGFALASTGAKMAVVPALGSAFRRLSIRRRNAQHSTRTVGMQTSSADTDPLHSAAALNSFLRRNHKTPCCPLNDAPLASAESLFDPDTPGARRMVPQILEQQASSSDLDLDPEATVSHPKEHFLSVQPAHGLSRKSSTGDSAVDLKFSEDDRGAASPVSDVSQRSSQAEHLAAMIRMLDDESLNSPRGLPEDLDASRSSCDFSSSFSGSFSPGWPPSRQKIDPKNPAEQPTRERSPRPFRPRHTASDVPRRPFQRSWSTSSWRKLRNVVIWTPFMQQYKRHKYPWIQLAGHQDNFHPGEQGSVLKKFSEREDLCLKSLAIDVLRSFVPEYRGTVEKHGNRYIRMQDLLLELDTPSLMDCKIGVRTYLEDELVKARGRPPRKDLYEKMISVDATAPTPEEHAMQAVFKARYMQWRESISSTSNLGFRIEGIKKSIGTSSRNFKTTKQEDDVKDCLRDFTDGSLCLLNGYLKSLHALYSTLDVSSFFQSHEVIGSSLLFIHDRCGHARVWLIDFGNTCALPPGVTVDHRTPWTEGNHEDGYLLGLDNLIRLLEELRVEARDMLASR